MSVHVVPMTLPKANAFIDRHHRHHAALPGGFAWWAVGAVADGAICGVALAGRPTNRNNDDGLTVEIQRVATDGTPHVASALLGACARAAKAIGARRIITYTLETEPGTSLRAAGFIREKGGIRSWWGHSGSRTPGVMREHMATSKVRWAIEFGGALKSRPDAETESQLSLLDHPAMRRVDWDEVDYWDQVEDRDLWGEYA